MHETFQKKKKKKSYAGHSMETDFMVVHKVFETNIGIKFLY